MIQRVLEHRAPESLATDEESSTTLALLPRVIPPPRAGVVVEEPAVQAAQVRAL